MRKIFLFLLLGAFLMFPVSASAQSDAALSFVTVQLWPEYDQPSMLVIVDFQTTPATSLPVTLSFRIPAEASLIAVASDEGNGQFINTPYQEPTPDGEYQVFAMTIEENKSYRGYRH